MVAGYKGKADLFAVSGHIVPAAMRRRVPTAVRLHDPCPD